MHFYKYQALGNDFVILDFTRRAKKSARVPAQSLIRKICDRKLGIGCDQLLLLMRKNGRIFDLKIYNQDGSLAQTCGNGMRALGHYLSRFKNIHASQVLPIVFRVGRQLFYVWSETRGAWVVKLPAPKITRDRLGEMIDVGNRHRVLSVSSKKFMKLAPLIAQKDACNVENLLPGTRGLHAKVEVYERGVGPTLACGSGACAVAVHLIERVQRLRSKKPHTLKTRNRSKHEVQVQFAGGPVKVRWGGVIILSI